MKEIVKKIEVYLRQVDQAVWIKFGFRKEALTLKYIE